MRTTPSLSELAARLKGWFDDLSESVQQEVLARSRRVELVEGKRLYSRGDPPSGFYRVVEGCILLSGTSSDGRETVLDFYGPGSWFGEVSTFDGLHRTHDAVANGSTSLLHLGNEDLEDLLRTHAELSRALLRVEALRLRMLLMALECYSTHSLEQRLANRLLLLAVQYGVADGEGERIELHLPQEILARLIGSTRQRVNQILKHWEAERLIEQQYGRIRLANRCRLEALAQAC